MSIVIIAIVGGAQMEEHLRSLEPFHDKCMVVLGHNMGKAADWEKRFPTLRFIDGEGKPVPLRRQRGVETAHGEIVALLEDTSMPEPTWVQAVHSAFADPLVGAAGGPVQVSPVLPIRFQALACGEYGRFHPNRLAQLATGPSKADGLFPSQRLPGNNAAYRRKALLEVLKDSNHGLMEAQVNDALRARGWVTVLHPHMSVVYFAEDKRNARLGARFQHGRLFASRRVADRHLLARLVWFSKSLFLPPILSARALSAMSHTVAPSLRFQVALWICLLETAWAFGESTGYLAGADRSLDAWR